MVTTERQNSPSQLMTMPSSLRPGELEGFPVRGSQNPGKGKETSSTEYLGLPKVCGQAEEEEPAKQTGCRVAEPVEKQEAGWLEITRTVRWSIT